MVEANGLWELLESYLGAERLELYDLELSGQGRGRRLRVVVDAEGGVDLDRITEASRGISRLLDETDDPSGPYSLEVTSPGLERKLRRPRHFGGAVGQEVAVKTTTGESLRGVLDRANGAGFDLLVGGESRRVAYADVASARTVFTMNKAPKPGKSRASR